MPFVPIGTNKEGILLSVTSGAWGSGASALPRMQSVTITTYKQKGVKPPLSEVIKLGWSLSVY